MISDIKSILNNEYSYLTGSIILSEDNTNNVYFSFAEISLNWSELTLLLIRISKYI